MPLDIGSTFVNTPAANYPPHLWIIISHPFDTPEKVVIVNLTSWRDKAIELNDESCVVTTGEHRFVKNRSYIYYRGAKRPYLRDLQAAISKGVITLDEDCSNELLAKVLKGAAESKFTPLSVIGILQQQELI